MQRDPDQVAAVAEKIVGYVRAHPRAADSAEGIRQWWIIPYGGRHSAQVVQAALDLLLSQGVVRRDVMPDGRTLYRAAGQPVPPEP